MKNPSIVQRASQWLVVLALLSFGFAMAQSEPTLNQVYATAQAGKLDQAQTMIQQVLIGHPKSAKAHFVRAELFARQGDLTHARESLATADKLSPGLAFAKSEAVQALRTQLAARPAPLGGSGLTANHALGNAAAPAVPAYAAPAAATSSSSWGLPLLLAGVAIVAGYFIFRRRAPAPMPQQAAYAAPASGLGSGLNGPQTFGMGGAGAMQPAYPQQGGYAQQPGTGLGGRIMGGVATGLAVGAGVMAAEAIGRTLMGNHNPSASHLDNTAQNDYQPIANSNPDMGGADFGINDAGSWDDGGSADAGGGGDWDN